MRQVKQLSLFKRLLSKTTYLILGEVPYDDWFVAREFNSLKRASDYKKRFSFHFNMKIAKIRTYKNEYDVKFLKD